jgi:hypothetical protein
MWCDVQKQHLKFIENLKEETQALKETTRWQKWISLWPKGTSQQTFGWGSVKRWRLDSTSGRCWYVK